ncbi:hypothetical protein LK537_07990 [Lachnoclostridium pacaense]|uniref:hypothetical protein n=1 Tax=Enterocloster hominis (ex Hitch et al. 2024) TaxID=1917870 RepID=UPI001D1228BF|nr:hypothetical protein [Lachnoclostridium pacaense]MCC2817227.1 hypothetical protein [Lachnoclostridium pacaense]
MGLVYVIISENGLSILSEKEVEAKMYKESVQWIMDNKEIWNAMCRTDGNYLTYETLVELLDLFMYKAKENEGYEVMLLLIMTTYKRWLTIKE